jgi:putative ABC transport system permease protein
LATTIQDARFELRGLRRNPGFTTVVILTLALGIGANTAMFTVVNGVLLQPLPYDEPDRLVALAELTPSGDDFTFSAANFRDVRENATLLEDVCLYTGTRLTLTGLGEAEQVRGMRVASGFFELLGVDLPIGRPFRPEDDTADAEPSVIVSFGEWQQRFAGDPEVLGRILRLNGVPHTVVGVAPAGFEFMDDEADFYVTWRFQESDWNNRGGHMWRAFARLDDGATLAAARRELAAIAARLSESYPDTNEGWGMTARPLREELVGRARPALLVLQAAVVLVLLVACVNVASLLLARSESRRHEIAVRAALGAGRGRLARQLVTQGILLSLGSALVGLMLAHWSMELLLAQAGGSLPRFAELRFDTTVLLFTFATAALSATLVGLYPALRAGRHDVNEWLCHGGRGSTRLGRGTVRKSLVALEMAMAVVLVVGAMLLVRSLWQLQSVDLGYEPEGTLTFRIRLPTSEYDEPEKRADFFARLEQELGELRGVDAVGSVGLLPLFVSQNTDIVVGDPEREGSAQFRWATPGYFEAMGMPILRGRTFTAADTTTTPLVAVVSRSLVQRYFPGSDPLGQRIQTFWDERPFTIVGVVGDVHTFRLDQPPAPTMYWAHRQFESRASMSTVIRASEDPMALSSSVRPIVARLDPDVAVSEFEGLEDRVDRSLRSERFTASLLGFFALLALMLGAVGVYGVMAYSVNERTNEVGVRIALGARSSQVVALVLRQGLSLAAVGIAIGLLVALALAGALRGLLYGVSSADPTTFAAVALFLAVVALLACWLPARRAARVDPMVTLRRG